MAAQTGDTVAVHYTGTLDDGSTFDSSRGQGPLEFTLGTGQVIAGFNEAVSGMSVGDTKTVRIPAQDAYGPRRDELRFELPRTQLPAGLALEPGTEIGLQDESGQQMSARVAAIDETNVTLDANHPLAGEALTFALELMEIR